MFIQSKLTKTLSISSAIINYTKLLTLISAVCLKIKITFIKKYGVS